MPSRAVRKSTWILGSDSMGTAWEMRLFLIWKMRNIHLQRTNMAISWQIPPYFIAKNTSSKGWNCPLSCWLFGEGKL